MTRNQSANNFNLHSHIWLHPEGVELHVSEERATVTEHICHKVDFRANETIAKNSSVNINTACVFVWAGKYPERRRKRAEERQEDRKKKR